MKPGYECMGAPYEGIEASSVNCEAFGKLVHLRALRNLLNALKKLSGRSEPLAAAGVGFKAAEVLKLSVQLALHSFRVASRVLALREMNEAEQPNQVMVTGLDLTQPSPNGVSKISGARNRRHSNLYRRRRITRGEEVNDAGIPVPIDGTWR